MTKEQLWYLCHVYPEKVDSRYAKKLFDRPEYAHGGKDSYWEAIKKIVDEYYKVKPEGD
jgi:hypothetical protein